MIFLVSIDMVELINNTTARTAELSGLNSYVVKGYASEFTFIVGNRYFFLGAPL